jgi:2-(1,2-epoxy-1,2-dihydrophenyl)acetyl-CoA isomerase
MSSILRERRDGVLLLTLNRPDVLNALDAAMGAALAEGLREAADDDAVGAVVITGAGRAFCSGGDIEIMKQVMAAGARWEDFADVVTGGRDVALAARDCPQPVIAAVNGAAAGGGMGLALACDVRWASDTAKFAQAFVKLGLHPDWGSLRALPRLVGPSRALELMWTGDAVGAEEALRIGLVGRVLPAASLLEETMAFATRLAQGPRVALTEIKRSVQAVADTSLGQSLDREVASQEQCWNTRDAKEGIAAFLEKRPPKFGGR